MKMIIKKTIISMTIVAMMLTGGISNKIAVIAASGDTIVHITKTGECYHKSGCSSLSHSDIQTTLQSAVDNGLRACKRCKPPTLDAEPATTISNTSSADAVEALKTYKGNTSEFNAYYYYKNNTDLQTAIGADGDKLLNHYNKYGKTGVNGSVRKGVFRCS